MFVDKEVDVSIVVVVQSLFVNFTLDHYFEQIVCRFQVQPTWEDEYVSCIKALQLLLTLCVCYFVYLVVVSKQELRHYVCRVCPVLKDLAEAKSFAYVSFGYFRRRPEVVVSSFEMVDVVLHALV